MRLTKAVLKPVGLELMEIIKPVDDDDEPLDLNLGTLKEIKKNIMECAGCLEKNDKITDETRKVLESMGAIEAVEKKKKTKKEKPAESKKDAGPTWEDIDKMDKKALSGICKAKNLVTEPSDYDHLIDFRIDVAAELGIDVPEDILEKAAQAGDDPKPEKKEKDESGESDESGEVGVLIDSVNNTKKLKDLKTICEENQEVFSSIENLDTFKGLTGLKALRAAMLEILNVDGAGASAGGSGDEKPKEKRTKASTKKSKPKERRAFIEKLVKKGKFTQKEIIEKTAEKFPDVKEVTLRTQLTDAKNEKYCPYENVIVADKKGILSFND